MPLPDHAPDRLVRAIESIEREPLLDRLAAAVDRAGRVLLPDRAVAPLRGRWLGHALHPLLVDIPIGCWTGANLIDLSGRAHLRATATTFMALGTVSALPALATGLAEWRAAPATARRTAALHAGLNCAGVALYGASLGARIRSRHRAGIALGYAGTVVATLAGYLGGHLATAHRLGSVDPRLLRAAPPR